jgi:surface protein
MNKYQNFLKEYKKEMIAFCIFIIGIFAFSISYTFAAVEPVRSIVIESENTDFASGEEGSWQVTKSGYWTNYGEAEVKLDVDTSLMTNNQYTDIIFVLDISGSMAGEKLDRVKSDSKELISSLLSNKNNQAALITFDTESQIVSELTNDEELLTNEIDNLQVGGVTNYYQALVNVDSILQDYQKESGREMVVLFLTDGYPNVDTPNQIGEYQYLKSTYPYITINGVQYEMGNTILSPIKEISDNQFIADTETLNNVLFDASVAPVTYDAYQIVDYIDNENFYLNSIDDIKVTTGKVELTEENGKQKITWTLDSLASGRETNLTMKLKLKDEFVGQGGIYPTNESTEVISKIENQEEDVTTTNTPILADNYKVIYDGNAPEGCSVTNIPETYNYSVFSTIEISDQVPSCEGYEFKGWSIATDGITRVSEDYFIMPGEDVVIKAEWSKIGITKSMNGTVNTMGDPIMKRYYSDTNTDYHSSNYKSKITSIVTKDNMDIPSTAIEIWDVSEAGDGSVIAYIEDDGRGAGTYKVTIGAQGNIIANSNSYYLFYNFSNVESIDLTYLDTSRVTNMSRMFLTCYSLKNVNLSNFDTSEVTNMQSMFRDCNNLTSLDVSHFDTSQVTDMSEMFSDCSTLTSLDVRNFDTEKVREMQCMFFGCNSLTSLDVSNFDTRKVINMYGMFQYCRSLTSLDLSSFDMRDVRQVYWMFSSCTNLTYLDMRNATFNARDYEDMFLLVPNGITIVVKDITAKSWIEARLSESNRTGTVTIVGV